MSKSLIRAHVTARRTGVGRPSAPPQKLSWPDQWKQAHWLIGLTAAALLTRLGFICLALAFVVSAGLERVHRSRSAH